MKSIAFKANRDGNGYVNSAFLPASQRQGKAASTWGMVIAAALFLAAATFICLLLFAS